MAKIAELTDPAGWEEWVSSLPPADQELCRRYPPDRLYLLKPTGQRVVLFSYNENGTVTVDVSVQWNSMFGVFFDTRVFGINPSDLEECDLPPEGDPTDSMLIDMESGDTNVLCEALHGIGASDSHEGTRK